MLKKHLLFAAIAVVICSCSSGTKKEPVTDIDVATTFVRSVLDNDFAKAEQYLYKDETNNEIFKRFKAKYGQQDKAVLEKYKQAEIIVNETSTVKADSIFIFNYSNSYHPADKTPLKLVRINGKWLVDLKYTFSGNM